MSRGRDAQRVVQPYYTKFPYHGHNMNTRPTFGWIGRRYDGVPITRRGFLRLACTASASAALVACGGANSSIPPAASSAAASAASGKPAASAVASASKSTGGLKLTVVYTAPVAQNMPVLVYVASEINHSGATLNVAPGIQNAADLRGKIIGDDQPGTISDFQTLTMLAQLGLQPADVTLRALGSSPVRTSSLLANQVAAAALNPPFSFQVEAKGYKPLANLYKSPFLDVGAVVLRPRIDELAPALVAFVDACRDGVRAFNTQPDLAIKVMQQYTKETDQDILHKTYDLFKNTIPYQEDQQPPLDGLQQMIDFLGQTTIPAAKTAKAEQFVDGRILARLPKK